jgi:hypothetical protein
VAARLEGISRGSPVDMESVVCKGGTVRLVSWNMLLDDGYSSSSDFSEVRAQVEGAIASVVWPPGATEFRLHPEKKGNGVKPIKEAFTTALQDEGWLLEHDTFDAYRPADSTGRQAFVVEWETGNISSSHRAINRMALGMLEQRILGGLLVVPTGDMYPYLTDRVGNLKELVRYFPLWAQWNASPDFGYLAVVAIEHDVLDKSVPRILKGTDGRALR